ncbi:unnamed protein product, partial [Closterium sp. NIES-54]
MTTRTSTPFRETRANVMELESGEFVLLLSLSTLPNTQLISVDPVTGALRFANRPGLDVFRTESDALFAATRGNTVAVRSAVHGRALIGYAAFNTVGLLLVATRVRATVRSLPSGPDTIYTVTESQWVKIPLKSPSGAASLTKSESKAVQDLADVSIADLHYFCETRDITRPFPSTHAPWDPDWEFAWNEFLSAPFRALGGLRAHGGGCAVLLQGFAELRAFSDANARLAHVVSLARRSRLHPGTRYLARGINAAAGTGNEVECEQIVWVPPPPGTLSSSSPGFSSGSSPSISPSSSLSSLSSYPSSYQSPSPSPSPAPGQPGPPVEYSTFIWRRGTVPI